MALSAYMLSSASVLARMFAIPDCLNSINLHEARMVREILLNHPFWPDSCFTDHVTTQLSHVVESLEGELFWST